MTIVFDAGPLITACKFEVGTRLIVDHLLVGCRIVIASSVEEEVAVLGGGYVDGRAAAERIASSEIGVMPVTIRRYAQHLADYALGRGECDSIELCGQIPAEAIVLDDYLAFIAATRLGLPTMMLPDLVVRMAKQGTLSVRVAEQTLEAVRARYRKGVVEQGLVTLREVS
jgi:predicted nucleic acid-binding protein